MTRDHGAHGEDGDDDHDDGDGDGDGDDEAMMAMTTTNTEVVGRLGIKYLSQRLTIRQWHASGRGIGWQPMGHRPAADATYPTRGQTVGNGFVPWPASSSAQVSQFSETIGAPARRCVRCRYWQSIQ